MTKFGVRSNLRPKGRPGQADGTRPVFFSMSFIRWVEEVYKHLLVAEMLVKERHYSSLYDYIFFVHVFYINWWLAKTAVGVIHVRY